MVCNGLLISWVTEPTMRPMTACFSACTNWASNCLRSVISRATANTPRLYQSRHDKWKHYIAPGLCARPCVGFPVRNRERCRSRIPSGNPGGPSRGRRNSCGSRCRSTPPARPSGYFFGGGVHVTDLPFRSDCHQRVKAGLDQAAVVGIRPSGGLLRPACGRLISCLMAIK